MYFTIVVDPHNVTLNPKTKSYPQLGCAPHTVKNTSTNTDVTHRHFGLGRCEQGHSDLTEVVKHQEVQLPTVDQLRH